MITAQIIDVEIAAKTFDILAAMAKDTPIEITRHGRLESVLISPELYERVKGLKLIEEDELGSLQERFEMLIKGAQSKRSAAAYEALQAIRPSDLGKAVKRARQLVR